MVKCCKTLVNNHSVHERSFQPLWLWLNKRFQLAVEALLSHVGTPSLVHWLAVADLLSFPSPA